MSELAKNQMYEVNIEGCTSEGMGVARIDGRAVFVAGALSSEKCAIKLLKVSRTAVWAKIERLLSISPYRVEPDCPAAAKCGGCDFRHVIYEEELRIKKQRVDDALRRIGGTDIVTDEIVPSPLTERYRNKVIFNVGGTPGAAVTGFYRPRSHDIIPVENCLLQSRAADGAAKVLRTWMNKYGIAPYDEEKRSGVVRRLFVRDTGTEMCVCVVAAETLGRHGDELIRMMRKECPVLSSMVLNINRSQGNAVLSGDFTTLWGKSSIEAALCGLKFKLSPNSFFQVNIPQAETLYARAVEYAALTGDELVLDLYCGTGTIGLCAARKCARVIGAEIVKEAVDDARENARRNGIENAEFICADAAEAAKRFESEEVSPDVIIVDPPRKGLAEEVIDHIASMAPERVVYVSCDPATLARDIKRFTAQGYVLKRASAVDMFPRTVHVETVVLLSRKVPDDQIVVGLELDELDATSCRDESRLS